MAGETTVDLVPVDNLRTSRTAGELIAHPRTVALRTTDLATNDITGVCKVPANSTTYAFQFFTDDLDSGSEALVWSIYIGAVLFKSGITNAVAKAGTFVVGEAGNITVTADTIVYLKATTAAATPVAGNATITPFYTTSS